MSDNINVTSLPHTFGDPSSEKPFPTISRTPRLLDKLKRRAAEKRRAKAKQAARRK